MATKKYFDSARRCADVLLSLQRDSGGWPDQWTFSGKATGHTGIRNGITFNDSGTNAPFKMMVMMYHITGNEKYVAQLGNLGPFIVKANEDSIFLAICRRFRVLWKLQTCYN